MRSFLSSLYRGWMRFAHVLGIVNTAILLSIVYIIALAPIALIAMVSGDRPLAAPKGPGFWNLKPPPNPDIEPRQRMRFQF